MAHVVLKNLPDNAARIRAVADVRRGRVILVDLAGSVGREQEKTRPCVVVSNDKLNRSLSTLVIVPITTHEGKGHAASHEVGIHAGDGELTKDAAAQPCQVRTIDKLERIREVWGTLSEPVMAEIEDLVIFVVSNR
jgi:mRNA interferase MazF